MPVMQAQCPTCPFRRRGDAHLRARIEGTVLTEASQTCHTSGGFDIADTALCRGARDFQLTIFHRLGVIEAPTDAAWAKAQEVNT